MVGTNALGGKGEQPCRLHFSEKGRQIAMQPNGGPFVIIQTRPAQLPVVELESERPDQVQPRAGISA